MSSDWLDSLLDSERMRETDRWAIEQRSIPSLELMERAGLGLARLVDSQQGRDPVVVVCGKGNNGGDGLVAARLLRDTGRDVRVLLTVAASELSGDPAVNLERLKGPAPQPFAAEALTEAGVIVDAILGTGFEGEAHGAARAAIEAIEAIEAVVVCADVPSGVDASTGEVAGPAVHADATATFHRAKPGLWIHPGKQHAGRVEPIDIGIPADPPDRSDVGLISERVRGLIPRRQRESTKFSSGHVLVVGGSDGLTGAPCLTCEAAMRAGAGYVTACVPASLSLVLQSRLLEVMTRSMPDHDGSLVEEAAETVLKLAEEHQAAVVLGPGLGRAEQAAGLARRLADELAAPLLIDADGLNAHAGAIDRLADRRAATILTPHAGELGRLLDISSEEVQRRRLHHVRVAAERSRAVVVLKGDDTLVAEPGGRVAVSRGDSPGLATAGTGDVLAGVIGALTAKGMGAFEAACAGVFLHAGAGREAAGAHGPEGVIASDVIAALPSVLGT